jgi:hypothetical protein
MKIMKGQFSLKLSPSIHQHLMNIMNPQLQVNSIMPHINLLNYHIFMDESLNSLKSTFVGSIQVQVIDSYSGLTQNS